MPYIYVTTTYGTRKESPQGFKGSQKRLPPSSGQLHARKTIGRIWLCRILRTGKLCRKQGAGGFQKAIGEVESYQTPVGNLMKAIAAVIALVGAFNIYFKMQNGDQDVKKAIMLTIGGCVAFLAMSEALPLFFK